VRCEEFSGSKHVSKPNSSLLTPHSSLSISSYPLMLPPSSWLVFGKEQSDPEGEICRARRGAKWGAKGKCRPPRYYSDPHPVR
jgi:hypothetical protein